jgi:hypothetical protein
MEVCPNAALHESPVAPQLAAMVESLTKLVGPQPGAQELCLEALEDLLITILATVGCAVLQAELERLEASVAAHCESEGLHFVLRAGTDYMSRLGPVRVARSLWRAPGRNTPTVCPLEQQVGILEGFWLPGAARVANVAMADLTATDAYRLFAALGLMCPSASSLGRVPGLVSRLWEAKRATHEALLRAQLVVPQAAATVCVSVDGVLVPIKAQSAAQAAAQAAHQAAPGKQASGPSGYREVGCATLSFHDGAGERLQTLYQARMPEPKKATLHQQLEADLQQVHALRPDLQRVYLADGAAPNWSLAAALEATVRDAAEVAGGPYRPAVEVVDFFHACEHLKRGLDAALGEGTTHSQVEFEKLKAKLKTADHGVDLVINALRYRARTASRANPRLVAELNYFRHQRRRMNYAKYRRDHLPIASGVVEAACKTLATQRLKRSGMAWGHAGGQAILNLRTWLRSERFDAAWQIIMDCIHTPPRQPATYAEPRLRLVA